MASIITLPNNKFRAEVRKQQTLIKSKTFSSRHQADKWGNKIDSQIELILKIKPKKIIAQESK